VIADSLRLPKTCSTGWSVSNFTPDSDSQSIEDIGFIERIDASASRRLLAAFASEMLIFALTSARKAAEATSGAAAHLAVMSGRFFAESREKCTIPQPRASANPQIPINAIAVNKRILARITTGDFSESFEKAVVLPVVRLDAGGLIV